MVEPEWPARGASGVDAWQEATRTPVRGATWQVRMARGGPTGIVGPGNSGGGAVTQLVKEGSPPIYPRFVPNFFPCGTMFPHGSYLARRVAARQASDLVGPDRKASIAWTRVHAIMKSGTCGKSSLSDDDRGLTVGHVASSTIEILHHPRRSAGRHVDANEASDFHQTHGYD